MTQFQFTTDWFTKNISTWEEHLAHLMERENVRCLEIGSWEGRSACWLLQNILTHPTSLLTCIDPFIPITKQQIEYFALMWDLTPPYPDYLNIEQKFKDNIAATGAGHKVISLKDTSQNILPTLPEDHYDAIYIDGSHWAPHALTDAILSWPLLRNGGILILDDYELDLFQDPLDNPKIGIDAFLSTYQNQYDVLYAGWQILLRKKVFERSSVKNQSIKRDMDYYSANTQKDITWTKKV